MAKYHSPFSTSVDCFSNRHVRNSSSIIIGGFCSVNWSLDTGHAKSQRHWQKLQNGIGSRPVSTIKANVKNENYSKVTCLPHSIRSQAQASPTLSSFLSPSSPGHSSPPISLTTLNCDRLFIPKLALSLVSTMFSRSRWIVSVVTGEVPVRRLLHPFAVP